MIDFSILRSYLPLLYHDVMRIWRAETIVKPSGAIDNRMPNIHSDPPLYDDIPCRIYFKSSDQAAGGQPLAPVSAGYRIMCDPTIDVRAGDLIVIDRYTTGGTHYAANNGRAGDPTKHAGHMEFALRVDDFA